MNNQQLAVLLHEIARRIDLGLEHLTGALNLQPVGTKALEELQQVSRDLKGYTEDLMSHKA